MNTDPVNVTVIPDKITIEQAPDGICPSSHVAASLKSPELMAVQIAFGVLIVVPAGFVSPPAAVVPPVFVSPPAAVVDAAEPVSLVRLLGEVDAPVGAPPVLSV